MLATVIVLALLVILMATDQDGSPGHRPPE